MATGLLISRIPVRVYELERICRYISSQESVTFLDLTERFTPNSRHTLSTTSSLLKEHLGFLLTLDLMQSNNAKHWEERCFRTPYRGDSFHTALLQKLYSVEEPRQRAFLGIYDELIAHDISLTTTRDVVALMESSSYADCFAWNDTKITFWGRFMSELGLLIYLPPSRIAVSIASSPLLKMIPPGEHRLRPLLETIHHNYFRVFNRLGDVHGAVARALLRLSNQGEIDLHYESDATHSVVLSGRRLSRLSRNP